MLRVPDDPPREAPERIAGARDLEAGPEHRHAEKAAGDRAGGARSEDAEHDEERRLGEGQRDERRVAEVADPVQEDPEERRAGDQTEQCTCARARTAQREDQRHQGDQSHPSLVQRGERGA